MIILSKYFMSFGNWDYMAEEVKVISIQSFCEHNILCLLLINVAKYQKI